MSAQPLLQLSGIAKAFPNVKALTGLSFDVWPGEVLAFVGENGAGKSTLLKILSGDYVLDGGSIAVAGQPVTISNPLAARDVGFRLVRQEPEIVPHVTVAENIFLGDLPRRAGRVDFAAMRAETLNLLKDCGFLDFVDPAAMGDSLSPAQKHIVEIMRAIKGGAKIIAFDEPTSSLTSDEVERLYTLIRRLRAQGLGVIYVTHRLHEVMAISDRVAVLRDGHLVAIHRTADITQSEIVRLMVGRDLSSGFVRQETTRAMVALEVKNLHSQWHHNISFRIRAGEILGFAGLVGAGRSELAKVIFAALPMTSGTIMVAGRAVRLQSPREAIAANIGFAPEDRKGEGLILVRSVIENASLAIYGALSRWGWLSGRRMVETVAPYIHHLEIKTPSLEQEVGKLSGGNQQKVVLARWLAAQPKVLILDEPTRAVDVGAKAEIYRLIDNLAKSGIAIMLISSEMPELIALSDRIVVMHNRGLSEPVEKQQASEEHILKLALGTAAYS